MARKTANVVLAHGFGINAGVTVDTHVKRLSRRLGLTAQENPVKVERELMPLLPQADWENWSIRLIYHGERYVGVTPIAAAVCWRISVQRRRRWGSSGHAIDGSILDGFGNVTGLDLLVLG